MSAEYTNTALIELHPLDGWDPRTGDTITRRWKGRRDYVIAKAQQLRIAGIRYQIDQESSTIWMVSGFYGAQETQSTTEPLADQWELMANRLEKSVWEVSRVRLAMDAIVDPTFRAWWRFAVDQLASGATEVASVNGDTIGISRGVLLSLLTLADPSPERSVLETVIDEKGQGQQGLISHEFVLRNTKVVAGNYGIKEVYDNVEKLMTTDQLKATEGVPEDLKFALPTTGLWLKMGPSVVRSGADKWEIQREWLHSERASNLYERVA